MKLEDYPTPMTDAVLARLVDSSSGGCCEAVVLHLARDLERKLALCRDALNEIHQSSDMGSSFENTAWDALESTKL